MKIPTQFFVALLMLAIPFFSLAQEMPTIIPPSPEASSLGKFMEVPISHYTGLPNISIPITSYEVGGKTFPVSINYHARGVKVEEIASRVGIGWALNAGGQISRQIRSQPDDGSGGYIPQSSMLMSSLASGNFFTNENSRIAYVNATINAPYEPDKYPDVFSIQANNISSKFIFDYTDKKPLQQSYSDLVIEYETGNSSSPSTSDIIQEFTVTDENGFKYYFGKSKDNQRQACNWEEIRGNYMFPHQGSYAWTSGDSGKQVFNAWMLMDIEAPNGDLVSFYYNDQATEFFRRTYDDTNDSGIKTNYATKVESHQFQLWKIEHKHGSIIFEGTDLREDLNSPYSTNSYELDKVKIYNTNNAIINTFNFYQSYPSTVSDSHQNAQLFALEPEAAKRLRLDSIVEVGMNQKSKPPYVFTYNQQELPNRFTNSQDHWGFYNGAANNQFLLFTDDAFSPNIRKVDTLKSLAGMLEKITYPTGGSTRFKYEHNIGYLNEQFRRVQGIYAANPTVSYNKSLSHFDFNSSYYSSSGGNSVYTKDITIGSGLVYGQLNYNAWFQVPDGCDPPVSGNCLFRARIDGNGNSYELFNGSNTIYGIQPGTYTIIVEAEHYPHNPLTNTDHHFGISVNWEEDSVEEDFMVYAAGKRIKEIQFLDSGNNLVTKKSYQYLNEQGEKSGVILGLSSFKMTNLSLSGFDILEPLGTTPGSPLSTYQGNTIGYEYVREYTGNEYSNTGRTDYRFSAHQDSGDYISFPYHPPIDSEWLRGVPLEVSYHKQLSNGDWKMVKKTENSFLYADFNDPLSNGSSPNIFTPLPQTHRESLEDDTDLGQFHYDKTRTQYRLPFIALYQDVIDDPFGGGGHGNHHYKTFYLTGGTMDKIKTIETLYDNNENVTLETKTETTFDYANHYQPSSVTSVSSDGIPVVQKFTYPLTITGPIQPFTGSSYSSNPVTALAQQNRVLPIETRTYRDDNDDGQVGFPILNELKSHTKTIYEWDGSILEPSKIQTAKGDYTLEDRIEFKDYDTNGNLLWVKRTDGMDICYIYGYNNTLPVAKIENATYTQVEPYVNNIQEKSNMDDDTCLDSSSCDEKNLRTAQANLRNELPNAMVTTYTYDPLIGVTSMTDPKGYTVYYEYDELNRLERIRDEEGKVMSENKYHYLLDN